MQWIASAIRAAHEGGKRGWHPPDMHGWELQEGLASALKDCEHRGCDSTPSSFPQALMTGPPSMPGRQCMSASSKPGSSCS